ncbi:MAG: HU family DNA-binding protein [Synergistaceae bacterium]|jgi:DNA-binding protein HU-beta|nr:HU family DNA-binding protein [Synergistaceae bacterium]
MTKAELVETISEKLNESKKNVASIVEEVFDSIGSALANGEKCTFVGFGVFEVKDRAAREGRNPQDPSKIVSIPAKKVPAFRPGKGLKEKVMGAKKTKKK